ncbi:carboxypeptidase-like regulatory domain-containing protein [Acidipila sp. 4G-K13]|uniref:Carboxypeptidase regulatory-like domain-containing protein n=2 Tax=Paracidobacterium acidisoli TaxID=2303751 RepID=A0A372IJV4_9BACT|nr:carboxypeptidase-like regulatory domain-containing protein [Paracidobacterium acidisoli]MBT9333253.1 carboxypeptidase-like regulatory domain-containing protein [Paracidobacterium acidisoli]
MAVIPALLVSFVAAHAQIVGGSISGTVVDTAGAAISGASVTVLNLETGNTRNVVTRADGNYAAPSVPVGNYSVHVTRDGFAPQERSGIALVIGQNLVVNFTLGVSAVQQQVLVSATTPAVNTTTQQTSGLIDERQVKELPLNGRSYDGLMTLNPATVNYTAERSGGIGTSNSSVGNMFSVSGHRPQDNLFLLNGIEYTGASLINVTPGGTSGQLLGVDAVREFNVVSDAYGASYGKREGAQVSIVTTSGTNQLHGAAYEFLRNSALDARNYFDVDSIPEFQRNQFGGSLGGPLRKDKLLLFGNYEGFRQNLDLSDVTFVPDNTSRAAAVASVQPLLALWPVANGPELLSGGQPSGIAEAYSHPMQRIREDFGTTRFDDNIGQKDLLFAVYTVDDSAANTPSANPLSLVNESLREQVASVQEQHVFSASLLNTARLGFSRASYFFTGSVPVDIAGWVDGRPIGAIVISGSTASNGASQITLAGSNVGSDNATARNLFTYDDHIYWSHGRHQIEAGGWLQQIQSNDNLAQNQYGQASFSTLAKFLSGSVATFTVVPSPTELGWRSIEGAAFIEDTFKVTPRFELRAGLRAESTNGWNEAHNRASNYLLVDGILAGSPRIGSSALTDNRAKFLPEPRLGFAWDLLGNGKTAIRGGFGVYHGLLDTLDYRLDQSAPYNTTLSIKNTSVCALHITPGEALPSGGLISPSNVQTDIQTPTILSWDLRVEQALNPSTALTVGYVGWHSYHQILSEDENEPVPVYVGGQPYYPSSANANPGLANSTSWVSHGVGLYNALEVDVRHSLAHGLQFRGNYTWSKNLDDGSAWNTSVSGNTPAYVEFPLDPLRDWGPSAADVRHSASVNATWELPVGGQHRFLNSGPAPVRLAVSGWSASGILTVQSGFPFSPQLGYNPVGNGDTRNPVRPSWNPAFRGSLYPHTVAQFFNPEAFVLPDKTQIGANTDYTYGNVGRDSLTGPGLGTFDLSLRKNTELTERLRLQFRAEFFNVLNHSNFLTPNEVVYTSATSGISPTAGVITATSTTSRQIQFGAKLLF